MSEQLISTHSLDRDNLIAGTLQPQLREAITLKAGRAYVRGSVLGVIEAENKCVLVDSTKADGSQTPYCILTDDVDATLEDAVATGYLSGEFNQAALVFGGADTPDTHRRELRDLGIYLKTTMQA